MIPTKYIPYLLIAGLILLVLYLFNRPKEIVTVRIPAVTNELKSQPPVYLQPELKVTTVRWEAHNIEVKAEGRTNTLLLEKYKDSLTTLKERFEMYVDAVTIREFSNTFEDEYLKLTISGEVQGKLNYLKPDYTIKEREVEVAVPEKRFGIGIYGGYGISNGLLLTPQVGIGVSYDLIRF